MVGPSENWERLVRATLRREKLRYDGRGGHERAPIGIAGSVPPSLTRETNIDLIFPAAYEIQSEDPNVARIRLVSLEILQLCHPKRLGNFLQVCDYKYEKLRYDGRGGHERAPIGIAGSVPPSLTRETNIDLIFPAAYEIQSEDPNVARIRLVSLEILQLCHPKRLGFPRSSPAARLRSIQLNFGLPALQ
ncbi:hypothetical protein RHGRI_017468 [Rhododendron griersonianum]|uniref:Uncharacterized protein n=1 Tax=Rhododendron griersonianum TaxID=479676 RepID=A0AAV6JXX0_9ERIC|nr:hypothetical protein RHGRI_017468 [Rhododendron griersonianum]